MYIIILDGKLYEWQELNHCRNSCWNIYDKVRYDKVISITLSLDKEVGNSKAKYQIVYAKCIFKQICCKWINNIWDNGKYMHEL